MAHAKQYTTGAGNQYWRGTYYCETCERALFFGKCNGHSDGLNGFKTKKGARDAAMKREVETKGGKSIPNNGKTTVYLDAIADAYFSSAPVNLRDTSLGWYQDMFNARIAHSIGQVPVKKITSTTVHQWLMNLRKDDLAQSTMKSALLTLNKLLDFAVKPMGVIPSNPADDIKAPKSLQAEPEPVEPFTRAEVWGIAETIDRQYRAFVLIGAFCGLRYGELAGLVRDDIEDKAGVGPVIHIRRQVNRQGKFAPPKTKAGVRTVPIPLPIQVIVDEHLESFPPSENAHGVVFASPTGKLLRYRNFLQRNWYPVLPLLGLAQRGPHALRHTFIRWGKDADIPGHILAALAGQKDLAVTMAYGQGTELPDLMEKINKLSGILIGSEVDKLEEKLDEANSAMLTATQTATSHLN